VSTKLDTPTTPRPSGRLADTWSLSLHGLRTVVDLELRQRVRSRRWTVALVAWFVVIGGLTTLIVTAVSSTDSSDTSPGALAFGTITLLVLGMGLLIAPAFTSTSINNDRMAGTLATLQATPLTPAEIVVGKLVAAWCAAAVFLVTALPFIVWTTLLGTISVWQVIVCFLVVLTEVAVVCAVGIGCSALFSRVAISTVASYLVVTCLCLFTVIVPVLATTLVVDETPTYRIYGLPPEVAQEWEQERRQWYADDQAGLLMAPVDRCTWYDYAAGSARWDEEYYYYDGTEIHTERVWWMVVPNPFVVVADSAPLPSLDGSSLSDYVVRSGDPLAGIRLSVREAAQGPDLQIDRCIDLYRQMGYNITHDPVTDVSRATRPGSTEPDYVSPVRPKVTETGAPVWPWGLGANLLLAAASVWLAVRRLAVPYRTLAKGTRVA